MSFIIDESKSPRSRAWSRGHTAPAQEHESAMPVGRRAAGPEPTSRPLPRDHSCLVLPLPARHPPRPCPWPHAASLVPLLCGGDIRCPGYICMQPQHPSRLEVACHKNVQLFYINKLPSWSFTAAGKYWVRPSRSDVSLTVINIDFVQLKYSYKI